MSNTTYGRVEAVRQVRLLLAQSITAQKRSHQRQAELRLEIDRWRERVVLAERVGQTALATEAKGRVQEYTEKAERERQQSTWLSRHVADLREKARVTEMHGHVGVRTTHHLGAAPVTSASPESENEHMQAAFQQLELDREIADIRARLRTATTSS